MVNLQLMMMKGLPASGKTTEALRLVGQSQLKYKRINKDDLRNMVDGGRWSKANEKLILDIRDDLVLLFMERGYSVIVDDTNLDPKHEEKLQELCSLRPEFKFVVNDFTAVPLEECIKRNQHRVPRVEDKVIYDMYDRYIKPDSKVVQNPNLDNAVIFDLDGTLALFGNANPYNRDFAYDTLNHTVFDELKMRKDAGYKIIICSGRNGEFLDVTSEWLGKNGVHPDLFLMRKEGDTRKDFVVKEEMFRNHILPNYYVEAVYDDRDRIVAMWRSLGLTCFQVAPGNF